MGANLVQLVICIAILALIVVDPWTRRIASVGLPLSYMLGLAVIHWLGGFIHTVEFGGYVGAEPYSELGFRQALWGTIAFAIGSLILAPLILRILLHAEATPAVRSPSPDQLRLPMLYVLLGAASYGILVPVLGSIPSIGAVSVSAIYLCIVGVCLACWQAYMQRAFIRLVFWLGAVCVIPFITIITLGFVGYGAFAAVLVFTFVATFYRPRWQAILGMAVLCFLGLSLFMTYFRDRPLIRQKVWGGAQFSDRIDTLSSTLANFEFLDLTNPRHVRAIDQRLNQNYFVGRAVRTIELGQEQFSYGEEIRESLLALVPRILWPDKTVLAGSGNTVSRYARVKVAAGTSFGIGHVMEFYINFGSLGVWVGFLILGILVRIADAQAASCLYVGNWKGFMSWFVPAISLLNVQGSLVELFGSAAASLVLVLVLNKILGIGQRVSHGPNLARYAH